MYKVGLIGLPNVGKSTLFNILTNANALVADYPFSTIDPNIATFKLIDQDVSKLAKALNPKGILLSDVEIWDIAGLIEGASEGEGLGTEFLGHILECDLILHVLRLDNTRSIEEDISIVSGEIIKFDHKLLQKPFEKARRMAKLYPKDKEHILRDRLISKVFYGTKDGKAAIQLLEPAELLELKGIGLLSAKPSIFIYNKVSESSLNQNELSRRPHMLVNLLDLYSLSTLTGDEARQFGYDKNDIADFFTRLSELIIKFSVSKRFYTIGHLGIGMWVTSKISDSTECARLIHTDLDEKIKGVRVADIENFIKFKDWPILIKNGLVKKYGGNYVPQDKDILLFDL